jgi:LmbE family N-acetylglucosaminyl deacetylase
MAELRRSAAALGVARVEHLGYDDSGMTLEDAAKVAGRPFALADVEEAAARLAALLREERADALTTYDPSGGYGHPDHVQVSVVGARAAELAGTAVVLEATVDRDRLLRAARVAHLLPFVPADFSPRRLAEAYVTRQALTHEVDVRRFWRQKRAAMSAHASQATADAGARTLQVFLRLPAPAYRLAFGREWFVERGRTPGHPLLDDVFATLRPPAAP